MEMRLSMCARVRLGLVVRGLFILGLLMGYGVSARAEVSAYYAGLAQEFRAIGEARFIGGDDEAALLEGIEGGEVGVVGGMPFSIRKRFDVEQPSKVYWDNAFVCRSRVPVQRGDSLLVVFWARGAKAPQIVDDGEGAVLQLYLRSGVGGYEKGRVSNFYDAKKLTDVWQRYYVKTGPLAHDFPAGSIQIEGMIGHKAQTIEIGGLAWMAFPEGAALQHMPRPSWDYEGRSSDAPWREEAARRIEQVRKGRVEVEVVDRDGRPVANLPVRIRQQRHAFRFGVAVSVPAFHGQQVDRRAMTTNDVAMYRKISAEHFNSVTLENALKWHIMDGRRSGQWAETKACLAHYADLGMAIRGHVMIWPSFFRTPGRLRAQFEADSGLLGQTLLDHIAELGEQFGGWVTDWDVTNETKVNRDFMDRLGPESMLAWYRAARQAAPNAKLTLNEINFGPPGGMEIGSFPTNLLSDACRGWVDYLVQNEAPLDLLGDQAHGGRVGRSFNGLTGPEGLWAYFDYLHTRYGKNLQYTELDVNVGDPTDPEQQAYQADVLRDSMIIAFAHPAFEAITQWGFWAGSHYAPAAALWAEDWTLRPHGRAYLDLVFRDWWTNLELTTDENGRVEFRGFFGAYELSAGERVASFQLTEPSQAWSVQTP